MDLMEDGSGKIFSLSEANETVKKVVRFTRRVIVKIDRLRQRYGLDESNPELPDPALREIEALLREWSEKVEALGASPKGYFTVDFRSVDPGLLYCWTYGEEEITHTHKVWENFSHRRPLLENIPAEGDHFKWVN
jgi:hypothetical protein